MENITNLEIDEVVTIGDRKYTRLLGGFGDGKPVITDLQVGDLLEYKNGARQVRLQVDRNSKHFTSDHIIDFQRVSQRGTLDETLQSLGYAKQSITQSQNIYGFSLAGFMLFLKFAEGDQAVDLYKGFIENYFKTKHENLELTKTLKEEIEFLNEEKAVLLGRAIMEQEEAKKIAYMNDAERINVRLIKLQSQADNEKIEKALNEQSKLTESKIEYMNQTDFGACFNLKIGSVMVGRLLKVVGLAMTESRNTKPYEKFVPKFAQSYVNQDIGVPTYKWSYNQCIVVIDRFLKDKELYEDFYGATSKSKLYKLINSMYDLYV